MQGRPARVPSPWIDRNISVMVMTLLLAPGRGFSALAPMNQNDRRDKYNRRREEAKWFQLISKPTKHEDVAQPHGDGRQEDDEERAVHGKKYPIRVRARRGGAAEFKTSRSPKSCPSPRP